MNKKIIVLFLALLLPLLIFVFLKFAGKNQFDIPIYYDKGIDSLTSICGHDYSKPYVLPDSITDKLRWQDKECSIILLGKSNEVELKRLTNVFSQQQFSTYFVSDDAPSSLQPEPYRSTWRNCIFIAREKFNILLVDKQKRIRGYYSIGSREEMDRLIVEMKILLKQY